MTYKATINWMFNQLPMYQQKGKKAFNAKLDNTILFAKHLADPHKKFKTIHVAGTNGKGSSSHMLASVLQEAGYRVGLYTSPHLKDFRERIRINGKPIRKQFVVDFIGDNRSFFEEYQLSFFEMTVGMAFSYFAEQQVDIAVIEVGLGGRLDSTNIIQPEVSLITNIGMDHASILGDSLQKIATEKAGIIKEGTPVVISEKQHEVQGVFEKIALERMARLIFAEEHVDKTYQTDLMGEYQQKNIKGVVAALHQLEKFTVSDSQLIEGLNNVIANTSLMGRWQSLGERPKIICDTAHNKEGLQLVLRQLRTQEFLHLHMVLGFVKDKDLDSILPLFPEKARYYFCCPPNERGLNATILKNKASHYNLEGKSYTSVEGALMAAKKRASKQDLIYVGGSNFVVSEVL